MKRILSIMTIILFTAFLAAQTDSTNMNHGNMDNMNHGNMDKNESTRTSQADEGAMDNRGMNQSMTQTEGDSALKYASFDEISEKTSQKLMSNLNLTNDQLVNIRERLKEFQLEIGQIKFESQEEGTVTDLKTGSNEEFQEDIKEIENEALEDISDIIDDNQKDQWNNIKTQWWNEFTSVVYSGYDASTPDQNMQQNNMNNDDQINIDENQNRDNDQMNKNNSEDSNQIEDDNQNY